MDWYECKVTGYTVLFPGAYFNQRRAPIIATFVQPSTVLTLGQRFYSTHHTIIYDAGPTSNQNWINALCLRDSLPRIESPKCVT